MSRHPSFAPAYRLAALARRPLERFLRIEAASGIVLLVTAAIALAWASSPWAAAYDRIWHTPLAFGKTAEWLVNDALMVIFFFVVGMEIKRELAHGELSEWRRAVLPAGAALGGMIAPALVYLAVARDPALRSGFAVPTATDIAFAVGVLTLVGSRVPAALRVLLLALAVIDDLGAIVVIAVFYSTGVAPLGLAVAAAGIGGVLALQRLRVRASLAYVVPAVVVWAGVYAAGVHPTIAGVVVGLLTPVSGDDAPAPRLIATLHPWVAYGIMPVFALANAGVSLSDFALDPPALKVLSGAALGLVVGKPVGVLAACALLLRLGVASLPVGIGAKHLVVLGVVAGVGFTMALFVAQLAFADPGLLAAAKLGILSASAAAGVLGVTLGRLLLPAKIAPGAAESADEAEASTDR